MIGIDLIATARMERFMKRFGEKGLRRFLLESEIALINNHKTAAGFWAVKEAFSKALGTGIGSECSFLDICIYKDSKGAPHLRLAKDLVKRHGLQSSSLSITHDGEYAIAVVHLLKDSSPTDEIEQF